ncbi:MAG TPA: hypothetical protein VFN10_17150 [Thermoanaerobaculia bacterium]|nr:hypothetical protein [Thermoanaerobaculia bacterium]
MTRARTFTLALTLLALASVANASWYDDYDAGLSAARKGQWSVVVQKMSSAIKGQANENNKARTYGAIFINYHPYYYRGVGNLNLGNFEAAISDFEKTSGPGELDLGPIDSLIGRAKSKLEAQNTPAPEPVQQRPTPPSPVQQQPVIQQPPVQQTPAAPSIDPSLRQRAVASINTAKQKLSAAQQRRATGTQQYTQAMSMITDAATRNATARSNDDLNAIISIAENAAVLADLATPPNTPAPSGPTLTPPPLTRPNAATDIVLADYKRQLRRALEKYFAGEFEDASRDFEELSRKLPDNGWIWAFLGASQYSQYAFEADSSYKSRALASFRKAKQLRSWKGGLPEKYFSRRIRRAFTEV